jgi:hypothetical protein
MLGGANPYPHYEGRCSICGRSHRETKLYWDTVYKRLLCAACEGWRP